MDENAKEKIALSIKDFSLPGYSEIPEVGLYLEQVVKYISGYFAPLGNFSLTGSMISNYVKKKLIANPVKKQYDREQIAYLIFIAAAKSVLSMEDIRLLFDLQRGSYSPQVAYDYFCSELKNVLDYVFGLKAELDTIGEDRSQTKELLRNAIITVAHKVYLEKYLAALHAEAEAAGSNN
ncbi:MAG: DUF1836 domain-containing protein [Oscillospiraceae bacterium]